MKSKIFSIITLIAITVSSCVTNRITTIPNNTTVSSVEKDRIEILGKVEGNSAGARVWVLFIPLGWAKDSWVTGRAYKKALKNYPNADGILDQTQTYHKTTVPLIILTPQVKKAKLTGVAYHIRTDAELQEFLKNRQQQGTSPEQH